MMDVTLTQLENSTEIFAEADTGNKQWVAIITDTHPKYNYEREFVAYQKPKTSKRDSGRAEISEGDVVEKVRYTHSGKNDTRRYYQFAAGELHQIDETEITQALEDVIVETEDDETHECEECGKEFDTEHGVAVHAGIVHSEDESEESDEGEDDVTTDADDAPTAIADGGEELESIEHEYESGVSEVYTATTTSGETYRVNVDIAGGMGEGYRIDAYADESVPQWVVDAVERDIEDEYDSETIADGGLEVRDYRGDLERSDALVRSYTTPPGERLYAYRTDDGDHHIVVSRGNEPSDRWEKRVPAERDRLVPGEQLWTIPDNWELRVRDSRDDHAMGLFYNDEIDTWARISIPTNNWLTDAWYGVKAVGDLEVEPDGNLGSSYDVRQYADEFEQQHEGEEVAEDAEAFRAVADGWDEVEEELRLTLDWVRDEGIEQLRAADQPLSTSDWEVEFRNRVFRSGDALERAADLSDYEIPTSELVDQLRRADLLPGYYRFELGLDDSGIDMEYYMQALIEAGCSPPEALDYYMVEIADMTQSEWADERGIAQPSVSGNIKDAKRLLKK